MFFLSISSGNTDLVGYQEIPTAAPLLLLGQKMHLKVFCDTFGAYCTGFSAKTVPNCHLFPPKPLISTPLKYLDGVDTPTDTYICYQWNYDLVV